jgi:hypothetical protein
MCHAQPAPGGTSPAVNPQVALATLDGATNKVPSFITANGPVREARFVRTDATNPLSPPDGGVHGLFTIQGRKDAPGCVLAQPDFAGQLSANNVIFRIPTPGFGLGLVENTPDATLQANLAATASARAAAGIGGRFNTSGNDGSITRFGWKAQNKSLLVFAGEAYNVEQGVSNEGFPNERSAVPGCVFNSTPEDSSNFTNPNSSSSITGTVSEMSSDIVNFAMFIRMLAPPTPNHGFRFREERAGALQQYRLRPMPFAFADDGGLDHDRNGEFHLSSILRHRPAPHGTETGGRRQPGIGQCGRVPHSSALGNRAAAVLPARWQELRSAGCDSGTFQPRRGLRGNPLLALVLPCQSEANGVIGKFNALSASQQQDLLNFLRSL